MATVPGTCPQLPNQPTWCTVRDDPGCMQTNDTCILIRNFTSSAISNALSALALTRSEDEARAYLNELAAWMDHVPLDLREAPLPRRMR
jgi:hypothetical protein